jgi:pimeloyl-ACP methyl ester carboxylesterase
MNRTKLLTFFFLLLAALVVVAQANAQLDPVPPPEPDTTYGNVWYGAIPSLNSFPPDVGESAPVLVFIHGLNGTASYWFEGNDMYETAYRHGYRTVFISLNADNSPNSESIEVNAAVLRQLLPYVADHLNTSKMYLIGHSKGGVDIQAAMLDPATAALVEAVFTISSPNQGTELADWAFENPDLSEPLNLLTDGVESLKTDNMAVFRSVADPILKAYKIPFYTFTGSEFTGHPITLVTGTILRQLVPGPFRDSQNDGFVTIARSRLSDEYAADLGLVPFNHFFTDSGSVSFPKILGRIQGMEILPPGEFTKIAASGLSEFGGSVHNSWAWSVKWFKGKLYLGTGSEVNCVSLLTADVNTGSNYYLPSVLSGQCPEPQGGNPWLGAEIWCYTPETGEWKRVFKSPNTIPIAFDGTGAPTEYTARDIGFRSMEVFTEEDGTEALYVGGVTSGSVYDPDPFRPEGYPPPRLLRTLDGIKWDPVPQAPGTFLGNIGKMQIDEQTRFRAFRSLQSYDGQLFANLSDFVGSGVMIASSDPKTGNDSWRQVSPERSDFPVWDLYSYNGYLYVTTGLTGQQDPTNPGYGVYKTNAAGDIPYAFTPVVTNGGYQSNPAYRAPNGLSFAEFEGRLYVGTNRPTELIRINPDDSWDLVVGEPRDTPQGHKAPISGFGNGFGSTFTGHFWRMASYDGQLYLGTWDWSGLLQDYSILHPLDVYFTPQSGFDLWRSDDGIHWTAVTRTGMGFPYNIGARSLESTPVGLFMGTAGERRHACEVYLGTGPLPAPALPAPKRLMAASESDVGRAVLLDWEPAPGAERYRVYRSILIPLATTLSETTLEVPAPDGTTQTVTMEEIQAGALDYLCGDTVGDTTLCAAIQELKTLATDLEANGDGAQSVFPLAYQLIDVTTETSFSETPPTEVQSIYFVRAEDAFGRLSNPSNMVAAPSKAVRIPGDFDGDYDIDREDLNILLSYRNQAASLFPEGDLDGDGVVTVLDARKLVLQCTRPRCATAW